MTTTGRREPPWPEPFTTDVFTAEGRRLLALGHDRLRASEDLPRHDRLSTEDYAVATALAFLIAGRTDLLRRIF